MRKPCVLMASAKDWIKLLQNHVVSSKYESSWKLLGRLHFFFSIYFKKKQKTLKNTRPQ